MQKCEQAVVNGTQMNTEGGGGSSPRDLCAFVGVEDDDIQGRVLYRINHEDGAGCVRYPEPQFQKEGWSSSSLNELQSHFFLTVVPSEWCEVPHSYLYCLSLVVEAATMTAVAMAEVAEEESSQYSLNNKSCLQ